jgi:hypothetical protein
MDVSSQLGGSFLTHEDLPAAHQVWTISKVDQQLAEHKDLLCVADSEES